MGCTVGRVGSRHSFSIRGASSTSSPPPGKSPRLVGRLPIYTSTCNLLSPKPGGRVRLDPSAPMTPPQTSRMRFCRELVPKVKPLSSTHLCSPRRDEAPLNGTLTLTRHNDSDTQLNAARVPLTIDDSNTFRQRKDDYTSRPLQRPPPNTTRERAKISSAIVLFVLDLNHISTRSGRF